MGGTPEDYNVQLIINASHLKVPQDVTFLFSAAPSKISTSGKIYISSFRTTGKSDLFESAHFRCRAIEKIPFQKVIIFIVSRFRIAERIFPTCVNIFL